jgi:hypothetical protein
MGVGLPLRHCFGSVHRRFLLSTPSGLCPPGGGVAGRALSLISDLEMEEDDGLDLIAFCCLFQGFLCKITGLSCNFVFP